MYVYDDGALLYRLIFYFHCVPIAAARLRVNVGECGLRIAEVQCAGLMNRRVRRFGFVGGAQSTMDLRFA